MFHFFRPSGILADFVKQYWILEGNISDIDISKQRIIPNGYIEIMFHFGDDLIVLSPDEKINKRKNAVICGHRSYCYDIIAAGKIGLLSVVLKPEGAMMFFKMPLSVIRDQTIELEDIFEDANELEDMLCNATDNLERINIIDLYLRALLIEDKFYDYKRMRSCIKSIDHNKGQVKISDLAECACLSEKQFQRNFKKYIGTTPKDFINVVRFQNAIHQKQKRPGIKLTELALLSGYYDQSHFIHDFKRFSGHSPRQFFSEEEPYSDYFS